MTPSNLWIVLSALAFLGTAALLVCLLGVAAWGAVSGRPPLIKVGLIGAGVLGTGYAIVLLAAGVLSRDQLLPVGGEKYFCELDCHLAYSVTGLRSVTGVPGASGTVWAVTLQTRFDERTISPQRPREAPLTPNPRRIVLRTTTGAELLPLTIPGSALTALGISSTPITHQLIPGESYTTTLLFDLPAGQGAPASLSVTEDGFPTPVLIGHERSPFHGETRLALPESTVAEGPLS
jgi:hypothetical protein